MLASPAPLYQPPVDTKAPHLPSEPSPGLAWLERSNYSVGLGLAWLGWLVRLTSLAAIYRFREMSSHRGPLGG